MSSSEFDELWNQHFGVNPILNSFLTWPKTLHVFIRMRSQHDETNPTVACFDVNFYPVIHFLNILGSFGVCETHSDDLMAFCIQAVLALMEDSIFWLPASLITKSSKGVY